MLVTIPCWVSTNQKNLGNKLSFPKGYNKAAKSLTKKILTADLTKRYGCLRNESLDKKRSKWFNQMIVRVHDNA